MTLRALIYLTLLPLLGCNLLTSAEDSSMPDARMDSYTADFGGDFSSDILDLSSDIFDASDTRGDLSPADLEDMTPMRSVCGNGRIEEGESCEINMVSGQNCASLGFDGGQLSCDSACIFDTSDCFGCDFYISAAGDDDGEGSREFPWASLKNISSLTSSEGSKTVCLKRGDRFELKQRQVVAWEGNPSALLSLRSYGERGADAPRISGRTLLMNPVSLDANNNSWTVAVSDKMQRVFNDGVEMRFSPNLNIENSFVNADGAIEFRLNEGQNLGKIEGELQFGLDLQADNTLRFVEISEMSLENFGTAINVSTTQDITNLRFRDLQIRASNTGIKLVSFGVANLAKIEVRDSLFNIDRGAGIMYSSRPGPDRKITFLRNTFILPAVGGFHSGISISNGSGIRVQENQFLSEGELTGASRGISINPFGSQTNISIDRNFFFGLSTAIQGHALGAPKNFSFTNNIFRKNMISLSAGMGSGGTARIQHNTFSGKQGVILYGHISSIENNIFDTQMFAIELQGNASVDRSNTNLFSNPVFKMGAGDVNFMMWRQLGFDTLSNVEKSSPFASDSTERDPVFFRLLPGSLANDAGSGTLGVDHDFSGKMRTLPPDIGAWER